MSPAEEERCRVLEVLHSGFVVADLRRTAAFFRDCFGFETTPPRSPPPKRLAETIGEPGADAEIVYVMAPGHVIELLQYRGPPDRATDARRPCDLGFAHLSFLVADVAEVARAAAKHGFICAPAMPMIPAGPHAGRRVTYLRDANGFTIELMGG